LVVSAAIGISYYTPGTDTSVEDVFKRADQNMYENKVAMKAERKD
jgi:GGDEF domain-containing protein